MRNFSEMELKFGPVAAYYCLLEIEKAASIPLRDVMGVDSETRYHNACRKQDAMLMALAARKTEENLRVA